MTCIPIARGEVYMNEEKILERRIDSMVDFIIAIRKWKDISLELISYFMDGDKQFIHQFCYRANIPNSNDFVRQYEDKINKT